MPRRDGTGPCGSNQMSGRGLGKCGVQNETLAFYGERIGASRRNFNNHLEGALTRKDLLEEKKALLESRLQIVNKQLESL